MSLGNQSAFRKRWWGVPVAIAVALEGAFLVTQLMAPEYKATCGLWVAVRPACSAEGRVAAYLPFIKSDRVASAVISKLHLDISAADLVGRIQAAAEFKSALIDVSVSDSNSRRSAGSANALCAEFQNVAADAEGSNSQISVKQVENARAPQYQDSPSVKRYLAVSVLVGLFIGSALYCHWTGCGLIVMRIRGR